MALTDRDRDVLTTAEHTLTEAACALRALKMHTAGRPGAREAALALTALEDSWLRVLHCGWEMAGLDGLPQVDLPREEAP